MREPRPRGGGPGSNIINHNRDDSFRFRLDDIVAIKPLRCGGDQQFIVQVVDECISFTDQSCCQHDEALRAKLFANLVGRVMVCAAFDEALHD